MNLFGLTDEQKDIKDLMHDYAQNKFKERCHEFDKTSTWPQINVDELVESGFLGCTAPEEYGGLGMDYLSFVVGLEEIAKVCGSTAGVASVHVSIGITALMKYGTEEQKAKYLPGMCQGELMAFALTEPDAGTDAAGVKTTAVRKGDKFILNGQKTFISMAGHCENYIVIAITGVENVNGREKKEYTAFLVNKDTPGFTVAKPYHKLGMKSFTTADLFFDDVEVPVENMLSKQGAGLKVALGCLDSGRISIATQALGMAQGAIDETVAYVNQRKQFNKTIASFQNTQFKLAELQTKVDAARLLIWHAAKLKDAGEDYGTPAAMAKYYCADVANETTRQCVQLFGGYGLVDDFPIERFFRDAKFTEIYEGTSEAQKMVIARAMGLK